MLPIRSLRVIRPRRQKRHLHGSLRRKGLLHFDPSLAVLLAVGEDLVRYGTWVDGRLLPAPALLVSKEELGEPLIVLLAVPLVEVISALDANPLDAVSLFLGVARGDTGRPAASPLSDLIPDASVADAFFVSAKAQLCDGPARAGHCGNRAVG
jgi:hypothetical protein